MTSFAVSFKKVPRAVRAFLPRQHLGNFGNTQRGWLNPDASRILSKSLDDLHGILAYIAQDNPSAAQRFVTKLEERCNLIAGFPHIGTDRKELMPSLRVFTYRGYSIYFRTLDDHVRIERVFHPGINITKELFDS